MLNYGKLGAQIGQQHVNGSVHNTYHFHNDQAPQTDLSKKVAFRDDCIRSLDFPSSGERLSNIKTAHRLTCSWLLERPEFCAWQDPEKRTEHHGFLWIKGKPGTGKSTIMKFISSKALEDTTYGTLITFFFNARGDALGKSTQGLYQSLLHQIANALPEVQEVFDSQFAFGKIPRWTTDNLQSTIEQAIKRLRGKAITCLVDALDECQDEDVRDMVRFFEDLSETASSCDVQLRICFSSRHYPYITIRHGLRLILEEQPEHRADIEAYIDSELVVGAQDIRQKLLNKARGSFLWIKLVVPILNSRWERGRLRGLEDVLEQIPNKLEQLFDDITNLDLDRDDGKELDLCVRWVLFAIRPLTLQELYFGIVLGIDATIDVVHEADTQDRAAMERFVLDCSKGLVEVTVTTREVVQFIHETVREYFLMRLEKQDPAALHVNRSHEILKNCCRAYIDNLDINVPLLRKGYADSNLCFLAYSVDFVHDHSNAADHMSSPQAQFLKEFEFDQWLKAHRLLYGKYPRTVWPNGIPSRLYILVRDGLSVLVRYEVQNIALIEFEPGDYAYPLCLALERKDHRMLRALLKPAVKASKTNQVDSKAVGFLLAQTGNDIYRAVHGESPLIYAIRKGYIPLIQCLLATKRIDIDRCCGSDKHTALMAAAESGEDLIAHMLVEAGASLALATDKDHSPLVIAAGLDYRGVVSVILDAHEAKGTEDPWLDAALFQAAENGHRATVHNLLRAGANVNYIDDAGKSVLLSASLNYQLDVVNRLLEENPNLDQPAKHRPALAAVLNHDPRLMPSILEILENGPRWDWDAKPPKEVQSDIFIPKAYKDLYESVKYGKPSDDDIADNGKLQETIELDEDSPSLQYVTDHLHFQSAFEKEVGLCRNRIVKSLLEAGADPNARWVAPVTMPQNLSGHSLLAIAATHGYARDVQYLLQAGADPDYHNTTEATPLTLAAREGYEDVVMALIGSRADLNLSCPFPGTALSAAAFRGHAGIVKKLLESGADINAPAGDFGSALVAAVSRGNLEITRVLLERGASIHIHGPKYGTALQTAQNRHYDEVISLLTPYSTSVEP